MAQLALEVGASILLVIGVIWAMWRLPWKEGSFYDWAPPLALWSVWTGVAAMIVSAAPWLDLLPVRWLVTAFLVLDPAALTSATLTLWIYRGADPPEQTIQLQRLQAKLGIALGLVAVALGYLFIYFHRGPAVA